MTTLSAGKLWGLRRLADERGLYHMLAVDQRPPIMNRLRAVRGTAPDAEVSAVERLLVEELAPHASAVLVDPVWARPFVWDVLDPRRGLLLTLESHAFEDGPGGRRTASIPGWSVGKSRRVGGDAVKVLAYFRPDAAPEVIAHRKAYVRAVGAACRAHDLPFVLELLVYPFADGPPGGDCVEDPLKRPELVIESVRTFADATYGVDLFKPESPVPAERVPEPDSPESARVQPLFDALGRAAGRPWVMPSAGAGPEAFRRAPVHTFRAGASGFRAGRAIWWDAFQAWTDAERMRARLRDGAVPCLEAISDLACAHATPRQRHPRWAPYGPASPWPATLSPSAMRRRDPGKLRVRRARASRQRRRACSQATRRQPGRPSRKTAGSSSCDGVARGSVRASQVMSGRHRRMVSRAVALRGPPRQPGSGLDVLGCVERAPPNSSVFGAPLFSACKDEERHDGRAVERIGP